MNSIGADSVGSIKYKTQKDRVGLDQVVNSTKLKQTTPYTIDEETQNEQLSYWENLQDQITSTDTLVGTFENSINSLSDAFVEMFSSGEVSFKSLVTSMLDGLRQIINGLLAQAIAGIIAKESSSKGIVGLAVAAAGVAALEGMWQSKVPEFANGGIVYGNTIARVGEYSGARSNPEVIAPLNKLKSLLGNDNNDYSGNVAFEIRGDKLVGVLDNYNKKINRTR